jgi:hypothetical protein
MKVDKKKVELTDEEKREKQIQKLMKRVVFLSFMDRMADFAILTFGTLVFCNITNIFPNRALWEYFVLWWVPTFFVREIAKRVREGWGK